MSLRQFQPRTITFPDRDAWRAYRRNSIGGSSAPTLAGFNDWKLRDELWAEMVGLIEPDDMTDNEPAYWGTRFEPLLLEDLAKVRGIDVHRWDQTSLVLHPETEGIHDTPDGIATVNGEHIVVQIKTTSAWKADDWRDEPPPEVYTQVQHELEVLDLERAIVGVLIGGQSFRTFDVERDREVGAWLVARAIEFLGWVNDRIEPPHDSRHPMTAGLAKRIHPKPARETVALDPGFVAHDERRADLDKAIKSLTEERDQINERIRRAMGDANHGQLANGVSYRISSNGAMRRVDK